MKLSILATMSLLTGSLAQKVLLKRTNVALTFYYDNSVARGEADVCASTHGYDATWQDKLLQNPGSCGGQTLAGRGDDRMVALGGNLEPKEYCGKHVRLYDPAGKLFQLGGKNFYIKDTCPGCGVERLDVSGWAIRKYYGDCQAAGPPPGWSFEIIDSDEPASGLNDAVIADGSTGAATEPAATTPKAAGAAPVVSSAATPSKVAAVPASGGCACTAKGVEGCVGGKRAICNSADGVDQTALKWDVVGGACSAACLRKRIGPDRLS